MFDFSGKVVIFTGSCSGIAKDAVVSFARYGAQVVVSGRKADRVAAVAAKCIKVSPRNLKPLEIIGDIAQDKIAKRLIERTIASFGHLDILVNNAVIYKPIMVTDKKVVEEVDQFHTQVRAVVKLINMAAPHLISSKGSVVNVPTIVTKTAAFTSLPYSVSKASVDLITKCCAMELEPKGVRVNSLDPCLIVTPTVNSSNDLDELEKMSAHASSEILFLASEKTPSSSALTHR
ncbi:Carbonyl reductase [NADPH] 2 [Halotydeus destructor]|nr:Carbonyl reductase [NADPH] 2 [Halotydeus destructor]